MKRILFFFRGGNHSNKKIVQGREHFFGVQGRQYPPVPPHAHLWTTTVFQCPATLSPQLLAVIISKFVGTDCMYL